MQVSKISVFYVQISFNSTVWQRTDSICSRRKVSAVSDRSDTSDKVDLSGEESPGILSEDLAPESPPPDAAESDDSSLTKNLPWLKVISQSKKGILLPFSQKIVACIREMSVVCIKYGSSVAQ